MPWIVDGDNVLGTWPGRSRSDAERRDLVREIDRFSARVRRRVVVVFDGECPAGTLAGIDVAYSGRGRSADAVILARLGSETDRAAWTVVTSDRVLAERCRSLGARTERCDRFRKRLATGFEEEKPSVPRDVDYWLDVFDEAP